MLGRPSVGGDQRAIRARDQMVLPKSGDFLENRVGHLTQKLPIAGKRVMFPEMLRIPGGSGWIPLEATGAEDIVFRLHGPAPDVRIVLTGSLRSYSPQAVYIVEKRQGAFGKICYLRRPVVHLYVDVGVIVAAPGRIVGVVPKSLQISRQATGARG